MATQISAQARAANLKIGDYVAKSGIYTKPGVVVEKSDDGTVVVDTDPEAVAQYHRYSNTSGLTTEQKAQFNAIMDEVNRVDEPTQQLEMLDKKVGELRQDPNANREIMYALRNQQARLIRKSGDLPRLYRERNEKVV